MTDLAFTLDDESLDLLADRLAERVVPRLADLLNAGHDRDRWMDSREASAYLGISRDALHKLTASRTIPFEQAGTGAKCWFRRSDLDRWRAE